MAALVCSISGQVPEVPVITPGGRLYEKRLLLKALRDNGGVCPVSGEELKEEDLIAVQAQTGIKPRPVTATSVPALLQIFQNEWDSVMLETYQLKKQLDQVRQELTHALYQHDAACRVIARITKERDEARSLLHNAENRLASAQEAGAAAVSQQRAAATTASAAAQESMDVDAGAIGKEALDKISSASALLSANRKKRTIAASLAPADKVAAYTLVKSVETEQAATCMDIHATNDKIIAVGGLDHSTLIIDRVSGSIQDKLVGHSKKVSCVRLHPTSDVVLSGSLDKTAKIWKKDSKGKYATVATVSDHTAEVSSVTLHPTGDYFVTCSPDASWAFYDIGTATRKTVVRDAKVEHGFTTASFHPDGLILGSGTKDNLVRIWDLKTQTNVVTFTAHTAPVIALSFSENGYHLATTGGADGVKVWDLRKVARSPSTATPIHHALTSDDANADSVVALFDHSGSYLAIAGNQVRVLHSKTWETVAQFGDKQALTGLGFGHDASYVATSSKARKLNIYSTSS